MSCKHVVSGTGRPGYRGMECCPYCGAYELMFTQFQPVDPEDFKKMTKDYQGKNLTSKSLLLLKEALFLANLVNANVKPLARIEYPITEKLYALFEKMGLILDEIKQDVANGKIVHIIIISKHQDMIDKAKIYFLMVKPLMS